DSHIFGARRADGNLHSSHCNSSIARLRLPDPTDRHGQEGYGQKGCKVSTMGDMKILTVCLGNICRSPAAAHVLARDFTHAGLEATVASAGTAHYHVGNQPHEPARQLAHERGYDFPSVADQVSPRHIDEADLVPAMDEASLHDLLAITQ